MVTCTWQRFRGHMVGTEVAEATHGNERVTMAGNANFCNEVDYSRAYVYINISRLITKHRITLFIVHHPRVLCV